MIGILYHSWLYQQWVLADDCVIEYVRRAGFFHSFSVKMGDTELALTDGSDRQVKAQDIHVSPLSRGDHYYTVGCGGASQA